MSNKDGDEGIESSPAKKDLELLVDEKPDMSRQCAPEGQPYPAASKAHCQQVEGGDSAPLLCSGESLPGVLCPTLEPPAQQGHAAVGVRPEEGHKDDPRAVTPLL